MVIGNASPHTTVGAPDGPPAEARGSRRRWQPTWWAHTPCERSHTLQAHRLPPSGLWVWRAPGPSHTHTTHQTQMYAAPKNQMYAAPREYSHMRGQWLQSHPRPPPFSGPHLAPQALHKQSCVRGNLAPTAQRHNSGHPRPSAVRCVAYTLTTLAGPREGHSATKRVASEAHRTGNAS